jgi:putative transposase
LPRLKPPKPSQDDNYTQLLVALVKPKYPWYYEVSKTAPQYALMHLREAWKKCFNSQAGAPKFKKKGREDSFTLEGTIKIISSNKIQVPAIGGLKTYEILPNSITPKTVTISRKADKWFISFLMEVEPKITPKAIDIVGVDLGILHLATLSTGEVFPGNKKTRQLLKQLAHLQWSHRQKQIGSKNWLDSRTKIARLHLKIANIRCDYLHKLTNYLAKNHSLVVIEDLNVSGMLKNGKLASYIADGSFYEFKRQLEYKCQLYGGSLLVVSRWFPSSKTCHCCGEVKQSLSLGERIFHCEKCGWLLDRDLNAALNLERVGRATPEFTPVDKKEPTPLVEAGSHALTSLIGRFE